MSRRPGRERQGRGALLGLTAGVESDAGNGVVGNAIGHAMQGANENGPDGDRKFTLAQTMFESVQEVIDQLAQLPSTAEGDQSKVSFIDVHNLHCRIVRHQPLMTLNLIQWTSSKPSKEDENPT